MPQLEVDKIIPQSGTTLTIGETGDTISFASGVLPALESLTITGDLTVDTNTLFVDSTNNRVGIGTNIPNYVLDIQKDGGGGTVRERIRNTGTLAADAAVLQLQIGGTTSESLIYFGDSADSNAGQIRYDHASDFLSITTNASEAMRIDSSGNVGIGTTSPQALIHITAGAGLPSLSTTGNALTLGLITNQNLAFDTNEIQSRSNGVATNLLLQKNGGNVGIGTSTPSALLDVNGEIQGTSLDINGGGNVSGTLVLASGAGLTTVSGNYGNFQVDGGGTTGGYDGLNVNGHTVFMSNGTRAGIYNDTNNEWILFGDHNGAVNLYYDASNKLQTKSDGVNISGEIQATSLDINGVGNISGDITFATSYLTSINSAGLYVGTSSSDLNDANDNGLVVLDATGSGFRLRVAGNNSTQGPMYVNRSTADNNARDLINFYRNGAAPGYIRATNSVVTYQTFCGAHASQFSDYRRDETIKEGTVMESIDELCSWYMAEFTKPVAEYTDKEGVFHPATTKTVRRYITHEGHTVGQNITYTDEDGVDYPATVVLEAEEEHLPKCKISDTVESKGVYGVFHANEEDDKEINGGDMSIASLGAYKVRINANETVQIGDYLQSNGDGTAKVQSDDIFRASTIAKVTSTQVLDSYDDGSYTVPCTLHCG